MPTVGKASASRVVGLRDFVKELRRVDRALPKELRKAGNESVRIIVSEAQRIAAGQGPVIRTAAATLRPASTQQRAAVKLGKARVPWALGAEFGAAQNRPRFRKPPPQGGGGRYVGYRQFKPHRGSGDDAGYFMWPAIRRTRKQQLDAYLAAIERAVAGAFPQGGG